MLFCAGSFSDEVDAESVADAEDVEFADVEVGWVVAEVFPVSQLSALSIHSIVMTSDASMYSSLRLISFIAFI